MTTISLRVNDDESKLIHDYVSVNQLNMSPFIRDAALDKIELLSGSRYFESRMISILMKIVSYMRLKKLNKKKHMIILKFGKCLVSKCIK